jgi:hypothetical protein
MESWRLARNGAKAVIGNINFGDSISVSSKNIEAIFPSFLKDNGKAKINYRKPTYLTRDRKVGKPITFGLLKCSEGKLYLVQDKLMTGTANDGEFQEFTSDPKKASSFHGG